jgi:coenzyme F420-reducing hydrogenase beta subunit
MRQISRKPQAIFSPQQIVQSGLCIGCGVCVSEGAGRMVFDRFGQYKPSGPRQWYRRPSHEFSAKCPFSPSAANEDEINAEIFPGADHGSKTLGNFLAAYVGHVTENGFREEASSGGMTSWVLAHLLRAGAIDAAIHVKAGERSGSKPLFSYEVSRTEEEIRAGAKSRYYPVHLEDVLKIVREVPKRYAVVGVPCFVKALQLLRRQDPLYRERILFCVGLFCGHMKSARLVESFAWQMDIALDQIQQMEFRRKHIDRPARTYTVAFRLKDGRLLEKDWTEMADGDWSAGFFQNSACNFCDDVVAEVADVSLGDAWVEPYSSDGRGTNVVIVRSSRIHQLIEAGIAAKHLELRSVDADFVERTQAGGFRQRREGLAYRLCFSRPQIKPRKRVQPSSTNLTWRRKIVYRVRSLISQWSHRIGWLAARTGCRTLYIRWARSVATLYAGFAWSQGRIGKLLDKLGQE